LPGVILEGGNRNVVTEPLVEKRRQPAGGRLVAGQAGKDGGQGVESPGS
jgi:hypothetical protein